VLCFFIPFVNINPFIAQHNLMQAKVVQAIPALQDLSGVLKPGSFENDPARFTAWNVCLIVLALGTLLLLIRLLLQYLSYRRMQQGAQLLASNGIKLYQVDKEVMPFSFGASIFINQRMHSEAELREIVRHEYVHVTQRHTVDIILMELLCLLNWYNPFAWLLRHAVRQNLEFIADAHVIQSGIDKRSYQYLLLKVMDAPQFRIAMPFNFSSLKKRIVMMNKLKSAKAHLVKFPFILPLLLVLVVAFRTESAPEKARQSDDRTQAFIDTVPTPPVVVAPPDAERLPDDYKAFLVRNPAVRGLYWNAHTVVIQLKSGGKETYRLDDKGVAAAEKKWGRLPVAPPPPPPPPMAVPPSPEVAPPAVEPVDVMADAEDGNDAYTQRIAALRAQIGQLNDAIHNSKGNRNTKELRSRLSEQSATLRKELQALQAHLQQQQVVSMQEHQALLQQIHEQQPVQEQQEKAAQVQLQELQAEHQHEQKALEETRKQNVAEQKEFAEEVRRHATEERERNKEIKRRNTIITNEQKALQEDLRKRQQRLKQKAEQQ
jgi:hypothetical protein